MSLTITAPRPRHREQLSPALLGVGLATPPPLSQEEILRLVLRINALASEHHPFITRIFRNAGVQSRGCVLPDPNHFYPPDNSPTTAARMAKYAQEAPQLATAAAQSALAAAKIQGVEITHLFTASCTGFSAPGLDAALIERLGLSPQIRRLHIGFMGCHAAFNLLAAARDAARANPQSRILVCCVELCTLHLAYGGDPGKLIANALFADGAAAAVIGEPALGQNGPVQLAGTASMLIPDSREAMTWNIGDHGFEMTLSPGVPHLIREHLRPWCEQFLARHKLKISDIAHWAIHPGGPKILDAAAETLDLSNDALIPSRQVLAHHGNMSSATILFILQNVLAAKCGGPIVAIGLGPGLMAEAMLFKNSESK